MAKPYGLANQKSCYTYILLNVEKNLENETKERSKEWLVNKDPGAFVICAPHNILSKPLAASDENESGKHFAMYQHQSRKQDFIMFKQTLFVEGK